MKKSFTVSRKIKEDLEQYKGVEYFHSVTYEFNDEDLDKETIIPSQIYKELLSVVDEAQREAVLEDMGLDELSIDKFKFRKKIMDNNTEYTKKRLLKRKK